METDLHSIWLKPTGEVYGLLANLIISLSKDYNAPTFEPHLNLLGDILGSEAETIAKTGELSRLIHPLAIKLVEPSYGKRFFKCVFIRAEKTKELMEANVLAREIFARQNDESFDPHVSIMYGDQFSEEIKKEAIAKIGNSRWNFSAKTLYLTTAGDIPEEWQVVKEFELK